jgi:hypothetical protein
MSLLEAGVKTIVDSHLVHLPNLDVDKFSKCNNQEFVWEAEYEDGNIVRQFDDSKQNNYADINQEKLKSIKWISLFSDETSNDNKSVVVTLDFKTRSFSVLNGFIRQDAREFLGYSSDIKSKAKLILKMIKRQSVNVDLNTQEQGEVTIYNRYVLGWEDDEGNKVSFCIEPNGYVHLWK